jgi:hypothetical protein
MERITWKSDEVNIKVVSSATDCGDIKLTNVTQGRIYCRVFVVIMISLSSITTMDFLKK